MSKILDQYGRPIERAALDEPQTSRLVNLQNQFLTPMLSGLTPARLAHTLAAADQGDLVAQHRLFSDMEERDGHMRAEMDKRKTALVSLPWDIVPPRNATAQEKKAAEWVKEVLQDMVDPREDLLLAAMDAVGHGFAPVELEWRREGKELLPAFHPRPQEWFQLSPDRQAIHLMDGTGMGSSLRPFGWLLHTPGKAKTGYGARMGLYRTLVWPFLYKAYALGDFAEFLETYGLPIIVGKYFAGASADEKASLFRAVTQLGHDARAIMPKEMDLEIQKITGGGEPAHLKMMEWAERSVSKSILGQTLSADTGSGGGGSYALGKVHNEVRHEILESDARQVDATITRDLVYPLVALNCPGVEGLRRSPRYVTDLGQAADLKEMAEALPPLVKTGCQIPVNWVHEKLRIPKPQDGEAVLTVAPDAQPAVPGAARTADASTRIPARAVPATAAPEVDDVDQLDNAAAPAWGVIFDQITGLVDAATDLPSLQRSLVDLFGGQGAESLTKVMAAALALAELKGMADVLEGQ